MIESFEINFNEDTSQGLYFIAIERTNVLLMRLLESV